jgi:ClpX C4-type zinc finger
VRTLVAGPASLFICDECVDICTNVVELDDDKELFRPTKGNEDSGRSAYPALLDLARRMPTEELAHYVERGRKGVQRNRATLQAIERLATQGGEASADRSSTTLKTRRRLTASPACHRIIPGFHRIHRREHPSLARPG